MGRLAARKPTDVWNPMALEGRWRLAVRREPPGGLNLFRQAVLVGAQGACVAGYELCVLFLTDNDAFLGSGGDVP